MVKEETFSFYEIHSRDEIKEIINANVTEEDLRFYTLSDSYIEHPLTKWYGLSQDNKLVAIGAIGFYGESKESYGRSLGVPEHKLTSLAQLEAGFVFPTHRGLGLHKMMISQRLELLTNELYDLVAVSVDPANDRSVRAVTSAGFTKVFEGVNSEGEQRFRYLLELDRCRSENIVSSDQIQVGHRYIMTFGSLYKAIVTILEDNSTTDSVSWLVRFDKVQGQDAPLIDTTLSIGWDVDFPAMGGLIYFYKLDTY